MTTTFPLPPDAELTVELDDAIPSIYLMQGTDVVQLHPRHVGALVKALCQAESAWEATKPIRTPKEVRNA